MLTRSWAWHIALVLSVGLHGGLLLQLNKQSVAGGAVLGSSGVHVDLAFVSSGDPEVEMQPQAEPIVEAELGSTEDQGLVEPEPEPESEPEPEPEPEPESESESEVPVPMPVPKPKPKPIEKLGSALSKSEPEQLDSIASAAPVADSSFSNDVPLGGSSTDAARPLGQELIGQGGLKKDYLHSLRLLLQKSKRYPRKAQRKKQEGVVIVFFHVTAEGAVQELRLVESSGLGILDRAAIKLIERTAPFPKLPAEFSAEGLEITVPITYLLK